MTSSTSTTPRLLYNAGHCSCGVYTATACRSRGLACPHKHAIHGHDLLLEAAVLVPSTTGSQTCPTGGTGRWTDGRAETERDIDDANAIAFNRRLGGGCDCPRTRIRNRGVYMHPSSQ